MKCNFKSGKDINAESVGDRHPTYPKYLTLISLLILASLPWLTGYQWGTRLAPGVDACLCAGSYLCSPLVQTARGSYEQGHGWKHVSSKPKELPL